MTLRSALAASVLILLLGLAGCGGNDDGEDAVPNGETTAPNPLAEAAARTVAAGSAGIGYEVSLEGAQVSQVFRAEGEFDLAAHRGRLLYELTGARVGGADAVEVRLDGPVAYLRFPEGAPELELPAGRDWVRVPGPVGEEGDPTAAPRPDLSGMRQDPTQFLRYLPSGVTDLQEEGGEEVRGVETTVYTALIDLDRVLEDGVDELGSDEEQREAAALVAEELRAQLAGAPLGVTVSVDADGLVRRLLVSFDLRTEPRGEILSTLTITDFFDFGADVDVEPPPDGQVVEAADVA